MYMYLCEHKFSTHFNSKFFLEKSHIKFYYTSALFCFPFPEELKNFLFLEVVNKRYLFEMKKKKLGLQHLIMYCNCVTPPFYTRDRYTKNIQLEQITD